jgi:hypothetical protein
VPLLMSTHFGEMSVVRRNEGGGLDPRPGMGYVHVKDGVEKRVATRPNWKNSLEVSPGIATTACWPYLAK